jgi:outer membrane phospholipase A
MPDDKASSEAVQSSFRELSNTTADLNKASDDFGAFLEALDTAFGNLKIGVTGWVSVATSYDEQNPDVYTDEQLGFDKVGQTKGLAVRIVKIDRRQGDEFEEVKERWLLTDAPRAMRLRAIDYIPQLIQALTKEAAQTAKKVRAKADLAKQLTVAINAIGKGGR